MRARVVSELPGPQSKKVLEVVKRLNGGWGVSYPFVHGAEGEGCYFKDLDGNIFLDFASQIASNPLGYNNEFVKDLLRPYRNRDPVKYAGQDFLVKEHAELLEELLSITPKRLDAAFLVNSGAEAIENALKVCLRWRKSAKYVVAFTSAFHGRTFGALSLTSSKRVQKKNFFSLPVKRLSFSIAAVDELNRLLEEEVSPEELGCIVLEHVQGEGGYRVADKRMVREIFKLTRAHGIPYVADEVQSGMGRTGKWWAVEHFGVVPDVMSAAKALRVGATISSKKLFPSEEGSLSSTWGGGHVIDLATGIATIRFIKKHNMLVKNEKNGLYIQKRLREVEGALNPRGVGLMQAFDLPSKTFRDNVVIECLKNGLVVLGCGHQGIRLVPPYIVTKEEIDEALSILEPAIRACSGRGFKHTGKICEYVTCASEVS